MEQPCRLLHFLICRSTISQNLIIADGIAPLATAVAGVALHGVDIAVLNVIHDRISIR